MEEKAGIIVCDDAWSVADRLRQRRGSNEKRLLYGGDGRLRLWMEGICLYFVKNDTIVSVEFNAKDPSGFIKAWDNAYMENMKPVSGTYPNEYTRLYGTSLLESQDIEAVDTVTGATHSGNNFYKLVSAAMEQAREGDSEVAVVR